MRSANHRRNIISGDFTQIGVGVAIRVGAHTYWCTIFN
jgi:uncharacterized protein YkwD